MVARLDPDAANLSRAAAEDHRLGFPLRIYACQQV